MGWSSRRNGGKEREREKKSGSLECEEQWSEQGERREKTAGKQQSWSGRRNGASVGEREGKKKQQESSCSLEEEWSVKRGESRKEK